MKSVIFATSVAVASAGGELALTWSDCGDSSTHGKTTEIQPTSLVLGVDTAISGSGDVDKKISGGTFDLHLTAGGGLINSHFTGNNCEASSYNLPLGIGTLSWDGLSCPVVVGEVGLGLHAKLSSNLPASLAKSHIQLKALDQDGDAALCVDIDLAKQSELEVQVEAQMPGGAFVGGMMRGLVGDDTNYKACQANIGSVIGEVKQIGADVKGRDFKAAIVDVSTVIGHIVNALKKHHAGLEAHDVQKGACVAAVTDLKQFTKVLENGDVLGNLRKNWLDADAEILDYAGEMGKYCTFREPNGGKCGFRLGAITRDMIVGLEATSELQAHVAAQMPGGAFVGGMMRGLVGDDTNYKACQANIGSVLGEVKQIVADVKGRDFKAAIVDVSTIIGHIVNALKKHNSGLEAHDVQKGACVAAVSDLKQFTKVLENGDVLGNLRKNWLDADAEILDYAGEMGKYCTFREPNGGKCGFRLGAITRDMIVGLEATSELQAHVAAQMPGGAFVGGMMRGLVGDDTNYKACQANIGSVLGEVKQIVADVKGRDFKAAIVDISTVIVHIVNALKKHHAGLAAQDVQKGACVAAVTDLKQFTKVLENGDVLGNLRRNMLAADAEILDYAGEMGKYCTFREPNGGKCGFRLGAITRDMIVGLETATLV